MSYPLFSTFFIFFFFNDTATTEIYTLSLHDALPICWRCGGYGRAPGIDSRTKLSVPGDRKSTRLNSSHTVISYAVFCLKKKKTHRSPRYIQGTSTQSDTTPTPLSAH